MEFYNDSAAEGAFKERLESSSEHIERFDNPEWLIAEARVPGAPEDANIDKVLFGLILDREVLWEKASAPGNDIDDEKVRDVARAITQRKKELGIDSPSFLHPGEYTDTEDN